MRRLFVLYDARCGLCSWARRWLQRQPAFVELTFLAAGSPVANRLFPTLAGTDQPEELVVVSDGGAVYRDGQAWIMCLYALVQYRELSTRLACPLLLPLARRAFTLLSKERARITRWLDLVSEAEIADALSRLDAPACLIGPPIPDPGLPGTALGRASSMGGRLGQMP